jgi:hypothetical protein
MNSMADVLAKAGVVSEDQAEVAKKLQADTLEVQRELRYLRNPKRMLPLTDKDREKMRVLEARLRILKRTKVLG